MPPLSEYVASLYLLTCTADTISFCILRVPLRSDQKGCDACSSGLFDGSCANCGLRLYLVPKASIVLQAITQHQAMDDMKNEDPHTRSILSQGRDEQRPSMSSNATASTSLPTAPTRPPIPQQSKRKRDRLSYGEAEDAPQTAK